MMRINTSRIPFFRKIQPIAVDVLLFEDARGVLIGYDAGAGLLDDRGIDGAVVQCGEDSVIGCAVIADEDDVVAGEDGRYRYAVAVGISRVVGAVDDVGHDDAGEAYILSELAVESRGERGGMILVDVLDNDVRDHDEVGSGGGSGLEGQIIQRTDIVGRAVIDDYALDGVGDGAVAREVLEGYRNALGLIELCDILGIDRGGLGVAAERTRVHDLVIVIGKVDDGREVEVESEIGKELSFFVLGAFYLGYAAVLIDITR